MVISIGYGHLWIEEKDFLIIMTWDACFFRKFVKAINTVTKKCFQIVIIL